VRELHEQDLAAGYAGVFMEGLLYCPREGIADLETHRKSSAKVQA